MRIGWDWERSTTPFAAQGMDVFIWVHLLWLFRGGRSAGDRVPGPPVQTGSLRGAVLFQAFPQPFNRGTFSQASPGTRAPMRWIAVKTMQMSDP